ncbi:microfibril-associated glycoprotein 4-like [Drosophila subpulchrella]|uniref:microfibril-associated glycoprotein 4-like n=1 Tax=Drosophila subpulchrella TaxID=1486046 RepID=UPI0018A17E2A|nr:microfibril-associated glycoprotein 4-like [Drosophila subpulchrella]
MKSYFTFFLSFWLLNELSATRAPFTDIDSGQSLENQCHGYCFSMLKPLFYRIGQLEESATKNEDLQNLRNQMECKNKLIDAQTSEIDDQREMIKTLTGSIQSLQGEIKNRDSQISGQIEQLKKNNDKVKSLTETLKDLESRLEIMGNQINNQTALIEAKNAEAVNLTLHNKLCTESMSKITDDLLKCNRQGFCPSEGPSGIYKIHTGTFEAPCSSDGWLTIQKRFDGSENFDRPWKDYKEGFGNKRGEFFIGLEKLHVMTQERPHELYIKLGKVNGSTGYAHYDDFKIGSELESYVLSIGNYNGTVGDSLDDHRNQKFTTLDRDNDKQDYYNCARNENGGWWYRRCAYSALNGKFYKEGRTRDKKIDGIAWGTWHNNDWTYSLTFVEMMIRTKRCEH